MFAIFWAILAALAAGAAAVGVLLSILRPYGLGGISRMIDAEPGRPGLRDADLMHRLSGRKSSTAVVAAGSRGGGWWFALSVAAFMLAATAVFSGSPSTATVATLSLAWSAAMGWRFGLGRQLRVTATHLQLRRARTTFTIPRDQVRAVGLVPSGARTGLSGGGVWLSLWVEPAAVAGLPEELSADVTVRNDLVWLRLDSLDSVATAQILALRLAFGPQWTIAEADGVLRPAVDTDLAQLFAHGDMFFDGTSGRYLRDGRTVGLALRRDPGRFQSLHAKVMRTPQRLPYRYEVRDDQLRTRWVISKPDSVWKTAFYVTDRQGNRVGTFRATSDTSTNFDLCGVDNQRLATLRPHERFSSIVDNHGHQVASWDAQTQALTNQATGELRLLCALAPIVVAFVGPRAKPSGLLQLESGPKDRTWSLTPSEPTGPSAPTVPNPVQAPGATQRFDGGQTAPPPPVDATKHYETTSRPDATRRYDTAFAGNQAADPNATVPAATARFDAAGNGPAAQQVDANKHDETAPNVPTPATAKHWRWDDAAAHAKQWKERGNRWVASLRSRRRSR